MMDGRQRLGQFPIPFCLTLLDSSCNQQWWAGEGHWYDPPAKPPLPLVAVDLYPDYFLEYMQSEFLEKKTLKNDTVVY